MAGFGLLSNRDGEDCFDCRATGKETDLSESIGGYSDPSRTAILDPAAYLLLRVRVFRRGVFRSLAFEFLLHVPLHRACPGRVGKLDGRIARRIQFLPVSE